MFYEVMGQLSTSPDIPSYPLLGKILVQSWRE
jgi:hypothetical protein